MSEQKTKRTVRKYDAEFKRQALLMVESGQRVSSVARALGICESVLHRWKREQNGNSNNGDGSKSSSSNHSELEREVLELRSKLRQVEMERDILKKAVSIFSRQT